MKERNQQIVIKWPNFMASRILAILYDEEYEKPKMSTAFTIFRTLLESGTQAAKEKYQLLYKNQRDNYYFDKDEFEILATKLEGKNENEKATVLRKLISKNK